MDNASLKRGIAIQDEKAALLKFVDAVESAIVVPAKALPDNLRDAMSTDGLAANLAAIVRVWGDQKIDQLDAEFYAL